MKLKSDILILFCLICLGCGKVEEKQTSLLIDLSLNRTAEMSLESFTSDIETYRFGFSGNFPSIVKDIKRKEFSQITFSDIPRTDSLHIRIEVLNIKEEILCEGEIVTSFTEGQNQHVVIPLRCI